MFALMAYRVSQFAGALTLVCAFVLAPNSVGAETLRSDRAKFLIEMPGHPKYSYVEKINLDEWTLSTRGKTWYVSFRGNAGNWRTPKAMYDAGQKLAFGSGSNKRKLLSARDFRQNGLQGREFIAVASTGRVLREWIFLVGNHFYQIIYSGNPGTERSNEVNAFFNSFRVNGH